MSTLPVLGASPVTLVSPLGKQYTIPLSSLTFEAGAAKGAAWLSSTGPLKLTEALLKPVLDSLVGGGQLQPGAAPVPREAAMLTARDPGSMGNAIKIDVMTVTADPDTPGDTTLKAKVDVVQTYAGLTLATVEGVLGKSGGPEGSRPGLALVNTVDTTPGATAPTDQTVTATASTGAIALTNGTSDVLKLVTRHTGAGTNLAKATVVNVSPAGTFDLTLSWSKTVNSVAVKDLAHGANGFGYVLDLGEPATGFAAPAVGLTTLAGGEDLTPTKAHATLLST